MKFALAAIILVLVAGIFHMVFTVVDYGYNNPDTGAFTRAHDIIRDNMKTPYYQNWLDDQQTFQLQFFGLGRFIILVMAIVLFAVEALTRPKPE